MSQIARCFLCDERVRIPDVDAAVWVRCPHCHEEFQLEKLVHDLPPRLEIVGERPLVIDSDINSNIPPSDSVPEGSALVPSAVAVQIEAESTEGTPKAKVRSPNTLHAHRVKRTQGSGVAPMLKVVLGGVAGLLIGQIILWWLPAPYQSDPFNLARNVPGSLQFLLPPSLRSASNEAVRTPEPTPEKPALETPQPSADLTTSVGPKKPEPSNSHVPPADLRTSLRWAISENNHFDGQSLPEPRHIETWYSGLKQLAFCVTNIDSLDAVNIEVVGEMRQFLQELMQSQEKSGLIAAKASDQFHGEPSHEREGIVVIGQVESILSAGELFRTTLRSSPALVFEVVSKTDPSESKVFGVGDQVMVLGVLVSNPTTELPGYKGDSNKVVFGGFPVRKSAMVSYRPR